MADEIDAIYGLAVGLEDGARIEAVVTAGVKELRLRLGTCETRATVTPIQIDMLVCLLRELQRFEPPGEEPA